MTDEQLNQKFDKIDRKVDEKFESLLEFMVQSNKQIRESIHDMETKLLTAFHSYAEGVSIRFKEVEHKIKVTDTLSQRIDVLERRVLNLETKRTG